MQQNSDAIREAMQLAASPQGQQLLCFLRQKNASQLQQAADSAASGDIARAKALLSDLLRDPQTRKLLEQLGGNHGTTGR